MNINKIRENIEIDKNKYIAQRDNIDLLVKEYDIDMASDSTKILFGAISLFSSLVISGGIGRGLSILFGLQEGLTKHTFFYSLLFYIFIIITLSITCLVFFSSYLFLHSFFLKRKLISTYKNKNEYKKLVESLLYPSFINSTISDSLLNYLKIELSSDEYQLLRFNNKEDITYSGLIDFIQNSDSIQMDIDKIKQEQMTIIKSH